MSHHKKRLTPLLLLLVSSLQITPQHTKATRVQDHVQRAAQRTEDFVTITTKDDYRLTSPRAFRLIKTLIVLNVITATSLSYAFPDAFDMKNQHWIQR